MRVAVTCTAGSHVVVITEIDIDDELALLVVGTFAAGLSRVRGGGAVFVFAATAATLRGKVVPGLVFAQDERREGSSHSQGVGGRGSTVGTNAPLATAMRSSHG